MDDETKALLNEVRQDVKRILGELGKMKGTVATISGLVSAIVAGAVIALLSLIAGCSSLPPSYPQPDRLESTVVGLVSESGNAYCSGVATEHGVATAAHCVLGSETVLVGVLADIDYESHAWLRSERVPVLGVDADHDVALLGLPSGQVVFARIREYGAILGEPAVVFGHPSSIPYVMTRGSVSTHERVGPPGWPSSYFGIDVGVDPGNSGSGVFDRNGEVIGIVSFGVATHMRGAVGTDALRALILGVSP